MAFDFFNSVAGNIDPRTANISLTGHSLGGGLAGLVGSIYNKNSTIFDGMGFVSAAQSTYSYATTPLLGFANTERLEFKDTVYGTLTPWNTVNTSRVSSIYLKDELLDGMISGRNSQGVTEVELNLGYNQNGLSGVDLHSMASLVMTMYADGLSNQNWKNSAQYFWPVLYNDAFATSIGIGSISGTSGPSDKLRTIIAYSAIDEGVRVFGDTGIVALYNDANDFGNLIKSAGASRNLFAYSDAITKSYLEFAGKLAINKISQEVMPLAVNGVLTENTNRTLQIDYTDTLWRAATNTTGAPNIVSRTDLFDKVVQTEDPSNSFIRTAMQGLWGNQTASVFERVIFAGNNAGIYSLANITTTASKANLFIGGAGIDGVTGSSGNDLLIGGAGNDTFFTSAGRDIYYGGAGVDTVVYGAQSGVISFFNTGVVGATGIRDGLDGSDVLYSIEKIKLSDGNDYIQIDRGEAWYGAIDGGAGIDTLTLAGNYFYTHNGFTNKDYIEDDRINGYYIKVVENTNSSNSHNNAVSNIEVFQVAEQNYRYFKIEDLGHTYHLSSFENAINSTLSYAKHSSSLIFNFENKTISDGISIDRYTGYADIVGTNHGDTYFFSSPADPTSYLKKIISGSGDDRIINLATSSDIYFYNGGNDRFVYSDSDATTPSRYHGALMLPLGVKASDISVEFSNMRRAVTWSDDYFSRDVTYNIKGYGTIFFEGGFSSYINFRDPSGPHYVEVESPALYFFSENGITSFTYENRGFEYEIFTPTLKEEALEGRSPYLSSYTLVADIFNGYYGSPNADNINLSNYRGGSNFFALDGDDIIQGDNRANVIYAGGGSDRVYGGIGDDVLNGGEGNDLLYGDGGNDNIRGGSGNDKLFGGDGNDVIYSDEGFDQIDGGVGLDAMLGGLDNDTYIVDNIGDVVTELAYEGTDLVQSSVTYTLSQYVENLTLTGTININGTGNDLNNIIIGNSGNNILNGKAGADSLYGGFGNDTYVFDSGFGNINKVYEVAGQGLDTVQFTILKSTDVYSWTYNSNYFIQSKINLNDQIGIYGAVPSDGVVSVGNLVERVIFADDVVWNLANGLIIQDGDGSYTSYGSLLNDRISTNGGDDQIYAYAGNDILDGGTDIDRMLGGLGNDTYVVDNARDVVVELTNEGTDLVRSSVSYTIGTNIENLTLIGTGAINGTGNTLNNIITGNTSNNILIGGAGADVLNGGAGIDRAQYSDATAAVIADLLTSSNNTGGARGDTYFSIEDLHGSKFNDSLRGDNKANTIWGWDGNDSIFGRAGNDMIYGGAGNDVLSGGDGLDTLFGGVGADVFTFTKDSAFKNIDIIGDFKTSEFDKITIKDLLQGYDPITKAITDFVQITTSGANSILKVDYDGGGNNFVQIATLSNVTGLTDEAALVKSGHLIV